MRKIAILFLLFPLVTIAQKKQITLEDIYKKGTSVAKPLRALSRQQTTCSTEGCKR
jgi:hypothetical protein